MRETSFPDQKSGATELQHRYVMLGMQVMAYYGTRAFNTDADPLFSGQEITELTMLGLNAVDKVFDEAVADKGKNIK